WPRFSPSYSTEADVQQTKMPKHDDSTKESAPNSAAGLNIPSDDEKQGETNPEPSPRDIQGIKWGLVMTAILSSIFLYALDITIVADIQPIIIERFGEVEKLPWLSCAVLLGATATNLVWGKIYSQFNAKWFYLFNVFLFEAGSAICGAAPSMNAMIIGRAICGIGGAGLYVGVMTLIAFTTTMAERPLYIAATGLTWGIGIVLGPVVGGAFSESAVGWRWAFYLNLLIGAVAAPIWIFLLPNKDARPGTPFKERAIEMDYLGIVLQAGAMTMFVMAISWGGITYPWKSGHIIGLFVGSGVLFIILGFQQGMTIFTTKTCRIIPVEFFRSRTVLILFAVTSASGCAAFVPIYFVPIFFQFTRSDGPLDAGIRLLPFIAIMVFMVFANGALMARWGFYMPWYLIGGLLAITGGVLMFTVDSQTSVSAIYGYTVILGAGVGMWLQASFSVAQAVVSPDNISSAVGFITLAQFAGITISLAIANTVFLNGSQNRIAALLPDAPLSEIQLALQGSRSTFLQSLTASQQAAVLEAIVDAISQTYILVIVAGSLVAALSLLMKHERLFQNHGIAAA
ncbi:Efflux pump DEP3, partial [Lachnellula suecica]